MNIRISLKKYKFKRPAYFLIDERIEQNFTKYPLFIDLMPKVSEYDS